MNGADNGSVRAAGGGGGRQLARVDRAVGLFDHPAIAGHGDGRRIQAAKLENAAKYGELKAVQTGGQMTRSLNTTLGNIEAVRAAARADPTSPTGAAISTSRRRSATSSETSRSTASCSRPAGSADAAYYRSAADQRAVRRRDRRGGRHRQGHRAGLGGG
jgi:hypothetical protein